MKIPENLSAEVQDLLLQLLDKNPETRMTLDEMRVSIKTRLLRLALILFASGTPLDYL